MTPLYSRDVRAALVAAAVVVTLGAATLSLQAARLQRTPAAKTADPESTRAAAIAANVDPRMEMPFVLECLPRL